MYWDVLPKETEQSHHSQIIGSVPLSLIPITEAELLPVMLNEQLNHVSSPFPLPS